MSAEGVRVTLTLVDLMNLNLVHRRLQRLSESDAFVHPEDLTGLVEVLDRVFARDCWDMRDMINDLRRVSHGHS